MNVLKPGLQATIKTLLSKGVSQREIVNWGLTKPVHRFYIGKSAAGVDTCPKSLTTHLNFPTVFVAAAAARSCQRLKRRQVKPRSQKPMSFLKEAPEVESAGNIESQHHPPPRKAGRSNIPPIPRHFPAGNRLYSRLIFQASGCCCVFGKLHAGTKHSSVSALCQRCTPEQIKVSRRIPTNKAFERYFHPDQALVKSVYATAKGVTRSGLIHGRCYIDDKRTTNRRTFLERWERKKRRVGANPRETE